MKQIIFLLTLILIVIASHGQSEILEIRIVDSAKLSRADWQYIMLLESEQRKIDFADGLGDNYLDWDGDMLRSKAISKAVFDDASKILYYVVNNFTDFETKRDVLSSLVIHLKKINSQIDKNTIDVNYFKRIFDKAYGLIRAMKNGTGKEYLEQHSSKELYALLPMLETNDTLSKALINQTAQQYPELLIPELKSIKPESTADRIVVQVAHSEPKLILNFATSTSIERDIVRRNNDPYVQKLVTLADETKTPLKAIFFLDEYNTGKLSLTQIDALVADDVAYYKKLVGFMNDSAYSSKRNMIGIELNHETKNYVQKMNELHNESEGTRFKIIQPFNADETYAIMVYGDDQFYTSSFLGVFNRLLTRMSPVNGYDFLQKMNLLKFRTFIRLNGNYNTLGAFLESMKEEERMKLLRLFVDILDENTTNSLEDAIDVATTFSSITDSTLKQLVIDEVRHHRTNYLVHNNPYGFRIYNILDIMFTGTADEIALRLNIPPIASVTHKGLESDSGEVVQQLFFPGDGDGKGVYNSFIGRHTNAGWKITNEKKWVKIESRKGKKVIKYANKPLDEPEDEFAQNELQHYLDSLGIHPSIIIQRGHSYHVQNTLDHLNANHKIVVLGACGGFNHLETIMQKSPDAQIISSKQIGSGSINWPILDYIDEQLSKGNDIDWVAMWNVLGKRFKGNALFDDYVPPHKNLGSLFLKAFYRAELQEGE